MMAALLAFDNPVFSAYVYYSTVVIFKVLVLVALTGYHRLKAGVFSNAEDRIFFGIEAKKPTFNNEEVERVRRNHLNDLENIPIFLVVGLLYVLTQPSPQAALWHFRVFAGSRILHTVAYQNGIQPWRAIFFTTGLLATVSMMIQLMMAAA